MKATVNGEPRELDGEPTLAELLHELGIEARGIAVAVNDAVVVRSQLATRALCDGDRVEVIRAVAGG